MYGICHGRYAAECNMITNKLSLPSQRWVYTLGYHFLKQVHSNVTT